MFEQATLSNGPVSQRVWTTFMGVGSQVALVSLAVLAPMVWPQSLPITHFWQSLAPPLPPGPKPLGDLRPKRPTRTLKPFNGGPSWRQEPTAVPKYIDMRVIDEPTETAVVGAPYSDRTDGPGGVVGSILTSLTSTVRPFIPPTPPVVVVKPVEKPAEPIRIVPGGNVQLGRPITKVPPVYPIIARNARISGDVILECLVGTDGRIHEIRVLSGNALLVHAAVEAAWQWVYEATRLNDKPIAVIANLTVSFKLN